jgi:SAM-dependent methyltransferase
MMQTEEQLKEIVRKKYSEIALQDKETNMSSCCGAGGCSTEIYNIMSDDYTELSGYHPDADLGLGCGLPTQFAKIKTGDLVVDLGSGAGNDCFIARHETGETGKVIGVDFTLAMIDKARSNAELRGFNNVEFRQGDIEHMPITSNTADVIVSNCVLNLVPNKNAVMKDIYRVLKPGGHFSWRLTRRIKKRCRNVCRLCCRGYSKRSLFRTYPSKWVYKYYNSKRETNYYS